MSVLKTRLLMSKDKQYQKNSQISGHEKHTDNSFDEKNSKINFQMKDLVHVFQQFLTISQKQQNSHQFHAKNLYFRELQPRDRPVLIILPDQPNQLSKQSLQKYITELCKIVWSRAFYYYSTNQLDYQHTKIYSSQQILQNLARLSQKYHLKPYHFQIINSHIQNKVIQYMFNKYPMTSSQEINRNVNNKIRQIDNTDQLANQYLYNTNISFKFRENGEYNDLIMKSINQAIKRIQFKIRGKSVYDKFEEKMDRLFDSVMDEDWMKDQDKIDGDDDMSGAHQKWSAPIQNQKIQRAQSFESIQIKRDQLKFRQKQKQKYRNKVQEYTTYKIGRKLPESTHQFTQEQMLSHSIKIQNPQVLRLLTKWCEQLQNKFTTPHYFQHYIETLKLQNGKFIILVLNEMKESLDNLMAEERTKIKAQIDQLIKNNHFMQSELLMRQLIETGFNQIQKYQKISSRYSIDIVNNLHSYIIIYLNRLIHGLLTVAIRFTKLPSFSLIEWPSNINLITFQVMDLLRCKCASGQKQILRIYNQLLKMSELSQNIKIVRVVNRLKKGTHDILINMRYHSVLCEIQLAVTSKNNKFIEYSNMFNHYLYQLKRSVFGPITELSSAWKCLDARFNFYQGLSSVRQKPSKQNRQQHRCKVQNQFEIYIKPFICSSCHGHYYHNNYIRRHLKCKHCYYWLCARCQIQATDCKSMLSAAYKNDEIIKKCNLIKLKEQMIPQFGICIFIESQEIKIEPFRRFYYKNSTKILGVKNKNVYQICDISTEQQQNYFRDYFLIFQLGILGKKHIKIDDQKIREYLIQQKLRDVYDKNKQKICLNHDGITNQQLARLSDLGTNSQKLSVKKIQIIGNKLESIAQISKDFRNVKSLQISKNMLTKFEGIQRLQKLQKLYVNQNKIKEMPLQVCHLWNLKQLSFCWNQLKILPIEMAKLHKLNALRLSNNKIQQLPSCILQLFYLNQLNLKNNFIKQIPQHIGSLNQLEVLQLQNNQITTISDNFGQLVKLQSLNLSYNQIVQFPLCFTQLKSLSRFNLRHNKIQSIPQVFNSLHNLTHLDLSNNQISSLPAITQLKKLTEINLNYNTLSEIPQIVSGANLRCLSVAHNSIKIFTSLNNAPNLQQIYLNNNQIQFLHQSLGKLQKLQILHIQHNTIKNLCQLKLQKLKLLNASYNGLGNFINIDLISLQQLDLSYNIIDSFTCNLLPAMKRLAINNNKIDKLDLTHSIKLKYLSATNNRLISLPEIGQKNHVKMMNLQHNSIRTFPSNTSKYSSLAQLILAYNKITIIPKQIVGFRNLKDKSLQISNNPIQRIECPQLLMRKGTRQTVDQYSHFLNSQFTKESVEETSSLQSQQQNNQGSVQQ